MLRFFFIAALLCFQLWAMPAGAAEQVRIQNRLGCETSVWAKSGTQEAFMIRRKARDGLTFSVDAERLRACDCLLVQPYMDSSFQFYTPFTLDKARALNYSGKAFDGERRLLAPRLVALVGEERVAVAAGLPLGRLAALMAEGMDEEAVERWLVALRLPGEAPGRYAVRIGESTWGYRDEELLFKDTSAGRPQVAEVLLTTPRRPEILPGVLADMRESGFRPLLLTVEGREATAFGTEGAGLDPGAVSWPSSPDGGWEAAGKLIARAMSDESPAASLHLAGRGLRCELTLNAGGEAFALRIMRQ